MSVAECSTCGVIPNPHCNCQKRSAKLMVTRGGEIHEECPDCRGECSPYKPAAQTRLTAEQWLKENWPQNVTLRQSYFIDDLKVMLEAFRDKSEALSEHILRNLLAVIHRDGGHHASEHGLEASGEQAEATVLGLREEIERLTTQRNKCADVIMEVAIILDKQGAIPPQVKALKSELAELQKAVWAMTPGGSEFANDTERCLDFIRDRMRSNVEQVKLRKAAEAEAAALRERERWIPVSERLPEIGQEVYAGAFITATFADGRQTTSWQQTLMIWDGRIWRDSESGDEDGASHWKALSAAPEAKS